MGGKEGDYFPRSAPKNPNRHQSPTKIFRNVRQNGWFGLGGGSSFWALNSNTYVLISFLFLIPPLSSPSSKDGPPIVRTYVRMYVRTYVS